SDCPQGIEVGIDLEPAGREVVADLEQWIEMVQRLLRLANEDVDPGKLVLQVGPVEGALRDRHQCDFVMAKAASLLTRPGSRCYHLSSPKPLGQRSGSWAGETGSS